MADNPKGATMSSDESVTRRQWRFFWPHASDDMNGARWRDEAPTAEEVAEWREDFADVWVETRIVVEYPPERLPFYDVAQRVADPKSEEGAPDG